MIPGTLVGPSVWGKAVRIVQSGGYNLNWSATNLGLLVVAAVGLSGTEFGYFSLCYGAYVFCSGLWRSMGSESALVTFSTSSLPNRPQSQAIRRTSLLSGLASATVILGISVVVPEMRESALALCIPIILLSMADGEQGMLLSTGRANLVTRITLVPALTMILVSAVVVGGLMSGSVQLAGAALATSTAVGLMWARSAQTLHDSSELIVNKSQQDPSLRHAKRAMTLDYLVSAGSVQLTSYTIAIVATVAEAGGYRGALLVTSPITTLLVASRHLTIMRAKQDGDDPNFRWSSAMLLMAGVVSVASILLVLIGHVAGPHLLGDTWSSTKGALIPVALVFLVASPFPIAAGLIQAGRRFRLMITLRVLQVPVVISATAIGANISGAQGAAYGLAAAHLAVVPAWVWFALKPSRELPNTAIPDESLMS